MRLDELEIGRSATVLTVGGEGALRRHLLDMGLTPKTAVTVRKRAPLGDPIELRLRGYELTLRAEDAKKITVAPLERRGRRHDLCTCGKPEQRQDHPVQPADRLQPACRQLPRGDGGAEGRHHAGGEGRSGGRPAGHLLAVPLHQRGDCDPGLPARAGRRTGSSISSTRPTSSATST